MFYSAERAGPCDIFLSSEAPANSNYIADVQFFLSLCSIVHRKFNVYKIITHDYEKHDTLSIQYAPQIL